MELYLNATSPYARLVRIVLLEKGLADAVTLKWCDPWADDADLLKANPAGRIPALVTEEGTTLSESMLIAVYLDSVSPNPPMLPAASLGGCASPSGARPKPDGCRVHDRDCQKALWQ